MKAIFPGQTGGPYTCGGASILALGFGVSGSEVAKWARLVYKRIRVSEMRVRIADLCLDKWLVDM